MNAISDKIKYHRILLKLSGEALMGPAHYGIHVETLELIASEIREIHNMGVALAVDIGGGKHTFQDKVVPRSVKTRRSNSRSAFYVFIPFV